VSEPSFTPGPWGSYGCEVFAGEHGQDSVCQVLGNRHGEATACLIAAAPEMYAALEKIRELSFDGSDFAKIIDPVLAKARGEQ
jgi:hypothetical protein